jgi:hypothetical protein
LRGDCTRTKSDKNDRDPAASLSMRDGPFLGCCREWELIRSSA